MALSDIPRVAEIHVYGWRSAYRGIITDDYLFRNMLVSKRMSYFENSVKTNTEESYVLDDGLIKAFLTIGACRDIDKPESNAIAEVRAVADYLCDSNDNDGVAKWLMGNAL